MLSPARWTLVGGAVVAVAVVALVVGAPDPVAVREHVRALGPWAPVAFLALHALVTTTPVPRTTFTLSAGILFGPWEGLALCLVASTASAAIAFAASRRLGRRAVARLGAHRVRAVEQRLSRRGLVTVLSARLVPALPFSLVNYTFGVTSVRPWHYLAGTVAGLVPGTLAVVLAGDAVTGEASPTTLVVFVLSGALGVAGMLWSSRRLPGELTGAPEPAPNG